MSYWRFYISLQLPDISTR